MITNYRPTTTNEFMEWMPIPPELWNTNLVRTYITDNTINIDGLVDLNKLLDGEIEIKPERKSEQSFSDAIMQSIKKCTEIFEDLNTVLCEDPILDSKIEITHHGKTTVALRKDSTGHVTNRGVARCNPCDSFNPAVGSMIALIRLLSSEASVNWSELDEIDAEIYSLVNFN